MSWGEWLAFVGYFIAFVAIMIGYTWTIVLFVSGSRYLKYWRKQPLGREQDYLWVFMVPALNEAVTIADSVDRLRAVNATHKLILVINDGSEDETGEVLQAIAGPDLTVFTRVPPHARKGKAAALNAAFHYVRDDVLTQPGFERWPRSKVIFGIVDADGRLAAQAPATAARHFDEPRVGGLQLSVQIYNESSYLTRMQGLEFLVFGGLFQVGRSRWGSAFMGGNGQFNRMSTLESVSTERGPWSDYLTEDQELGLRLLERGWFGVHEPFSNVRQQGLNNLRPLYRQRARWMQGNLHVFGSLKRLHSHHLVGLRRFDGLYTLIQPALQIIIGIAVIVALVLTIGFGVPYLPFGNLSLLLFFLQLSLGPTILGVIIVGRGKGWRGVFSVLAALFPYILYTWIMWPVVFIGLYRQLRGNQAWAKTKREAIPAG